MKMFNLLFNYIFVLFVSSNFDLVSSYDNRNQYHPSGRLLQVEYAKDAVNKGDPVVSFKCSDGVVVLVADSGDSLLKSIISDSTDASNSKFMHVGDHICIAIAGLTFDSIGFTQLAKRLHLEHLQNFGEPIQLENLCDSLSNILHGRTIGDQQRPLGVCLTVVGVDNILGPQVYTIESDGSFYSWNAVAVGKQSDKIRQTLIEIMTPNPNNSTTTNNLSNDSNLDKLSVRQVLNRINRKIIPKYFPNHNISEILKNKEDDEDEIIWNLKVAYSCPLKSFSFY